jgi:hypothetical protein
MRVASMMLLSLAMQVTSSFLLAQGQPPPHSNVFVIRDGGVSGRMESITIPPILDSPFSLTLVAEWSRSMGTGGTLTLTNHRRIMRDGKGRIYQERRLLVPKGSKMESEMDVFQITDPAQHTWYNCGTHSKICELLPYGMRPDMVYKPAIGTSGPLPDGKGFRQHEDLGTGISAGVNTNGYRETTTYNPGALGNDQIMVVTREFWYSPQLGINMISKVDTPTTGKQVFTVTELITAEPDPQFFEIPADYKVVDHRKMDAAPAN